MAHDKLRRNALGGESPAMKEADQAIYGAINMEGIGSGRVTAKPLSIFEIIPDALQPRRAMPSAVRGAWDGSPTSVQQALLAWWELARDVEKVSVPLKEIIDGTLDEDKPNVFELLAESPIAISLWQLAQLAGSIQRDGLTNPITVVAVPGGYMIETGERRWLAYHLLHWATSGADQWSRIPARVMDAANVWRQASENAARQDLNAIGRARQLALLVMALHVEQGVAFQPLSAFAHEQDFYAQVADGELYRLPRGTSGQVLAAMGLSDAGYIRKYRTILRLPREAWVKADDENWAERRIRDLLDTVPMGTVSSNKSKKRTQPPAPIASEDDKALFKRLLQLPNTIGTAEPPLRRHLISEIEKAEAYLKKLRSSLGA